MSYSLRSPRALKVIDPSGSKIALGWYEDYPVLGVHRP
jgi:hypothetical protein